MNKAACFAILVVVLVVAAVPAFAEPVTPAAASGATSLNTYGATGEVVVILPGTSLGQWSSNLRFKGEAYIDNLSLEGELEATNPRPYGHGAMTVEEVASTEVTSQVFSGVAIVPTGSEEVTITGSASSQDGTIAGTFRAEDVRLGEEFAADNLDFASTAVAVSGHFTTLSTTLAGDVVEGDAVTYETNYEVSSLDAANGVAEVVGAGRLSEQESNASLPAVMVVDPESSSSGLGLLLLGLGGTCGCGTALYRRRK